jgi:hypothetical protein
LFKKLSKLELIFSEKIATKRNTDVAINQNIKPRIKNCKLILSESLNINPGKKAIKNIATLGFNKFIINPVTKLLLLNLPSFLISFFRKKDVKKRYMKYIKPKYLIISK